MKYLKKQKIIIALFCIWITGMGVLTITSNFKVISKSIINGIKQGWNTEQDITAMIVGGAEGLEDGIESNTYAKEMYIDLYGLTERLLGRRYIRDANPSNVVVKDSQGKLQFITFKANTEEKVNQIADIKEQLESKGIPTLFLQTPVKVIEGFTELPSSVEDYSNSNTDNFLTALDEKDVDYIDLRKEVEQDGLDKQTLFYNTDHHWTNQTAFWAVGKVVDYLEDELGIVLDETGFYRDLDHYEMTTYEKSFLGSQGRRVGKYYAGVDDYTLITPQFDTQYKVTINKSDSSTDYIGSFQETIIKNNLLDMTESVYTNRYAAYFGGDYPEVIIQNQLCMNDKKIVIIKDSFALPFSAFLSTMVGQINMIDLRYFDQTKLDNYLEELNPDLVLYVYKSVTTQ